MKGRALSLRHFLSGSHMYCVMSSTLMQPMVRMASALTYKREAKDMDHTQYGF